MGGEIGVQSSLGVGSTFWFDVPFANAEPAALADGSPCPWTVDCRVIHLAGGVAASPASTVAEALREWRMPFTTIHSLAEARKLLDNGSSRGRYAYDALIIDQLAYDEEMEDLISTLEGGQSFLSVSLILTGAEHYPPQITGRSNDHLYALSGPLDKRMLFNTLHACYSRHSTEDDIVHIARQQVSESHTEAPLKVLVGDDNATNRLVLERMLTKLGHECVTANGGEAVLNALEADDFDVAIVDKNMPDLSGIEVFSAYSMAHGGRMPARFVMLTADATAEARDACTAAGIEHFLTKPVSLGRLHEALQEAVADRQAVKDPAGPTPAAADRDLPVVDEQVFLNLEKLAGDDSGFLREIVANFESDAERDMRELERAVAGHDWLAFRDSAHALKGAALYLGLKQLADLSLQAQSLDEERFEREGIAYIQAIGQATKRALKALRDRLETVRKMG
jgi:two-component system sensor histidine kinase RpfC